jgi:hypothetical protein
MKRQLEALVRRTRGGHVANLVLARINEMSEAEAEQWFRLLQNVAEDANRDGQRKGTMEPWRLR